MPRIRVGEHELDTQTGELRSGESCTRIQDKPLQVLLLLAEQPNALVTRDQIRDRIWGPSRFHDFEDSLNQAVRKLREAFGDSASNPEVIETIPRRGYRLIVPVAESAVLETENGIAAGPTEYSLGHATVGREPELQLLQAAYSQAAAGRGQLICISGEPGIGKTTLAATFIGGLLGDHPCRVAMGRCSERFGGAEAYLPILELLENLIRSDPQPELAELLRITAPSWFVEMPPDITALVGDGDSRSDPLITTQERRKREFFGFLSAASRDVPLVLWIDDLHWADISSVDLLAYAIPRCSSNKVLFLGALRPAELARSEHPFLAVKQELQAHRLSRDIELSALKHADVKRFLEVEYPGNTFPSDFAASIHHRTEGYPLFVVDLLQDLRNEGWISLKQDRWTLNRALIDIENLPDSVRAMVKRQIGSLSESLHQLLEAASVEGYQFHSSVLASVLGTEPEQIEADLHALQTRHGLIKFTSEHVWPDSSQASRYSFTHALYLNAVYSDLRPARRASLAAAIAAALLHHHERADHDIAAQLAHLFEVAADWGRASQYYTFAAGNAGKLSAYREAEALCLRAIELAKRAEAGDKDRRLLAAYLQLARSRQARSGFEETIEAYESAERLATSAGDVKARVEAICGASFAAGYLKRTDEMRERAEHAIRIAKDAGISPAYGQTVLGFQQIFAGNLEMARANHESALTDLRKGPPSLPGVFAAVSFGFLNDLQSEYQIADTLLVNAIEQIRVTGIWSDLLRASWFHGMVLANLGRLGEALETLTKAMELAELNGETFWYSRFPNTIGWIRGELGEFEVARKLNHEGIRAAQVVGTSEAEANSHINLVNGYVQSGDLVTAEMHLKAGEEILMRATHKHWLRWRFQIRLELAQGSFQLAAGDSAGARISLESALQRAESVRAHKHAADARRLLGLTAVNDRRFTDAADHYEAGLALLRKYPCAMIEWKLLQASGELARERGSETQGQRLLMQSNNQLKALKTSAESR